MLSKGFSVSSREICVAVDYKDELRYPLGLPTGEASKTYCTSLWSYKNRWAALLKVNHGDGQNSLYYKGSGLVRIKCNSVRPF